MFVYKWILISQASELKKCQGLYYIFLTDILTKINGTCRADKGYHEYENEVPMYLYQPIIFHPVFFLMALSSSGKFQICDLNMWFRPCKLVVESVDFQGRKYCNSFTTLIFVKYKGKPDSRKINIHIYSDNYKILKR